MGYLDKSTITVDAVLTNRGRELLSAGGNVATNFQITKFALADDEVDYRLYNPSHPLGNLQAGRVIENMPILEASTDESILMRSKLVTITGDEPKGSGGVYVIPAIALGVTLAGGTSTTISRATNPGGGVSKTLTLSNIRTNTGVAGDASVNRVDANEQETRYTIIIADSSLATFSSPYTGTTSVRTSTRGPVTAIGTAFQIIPSSTDAIGTTTVTVYGDQTGATKVFNLTVTNS